MNGLNDQSILDTRQLITGKDGQLYVTSKTGVNLFLAECNEFGVQMNIATTDYQPVGSLWQYKVPIGVSATLTMTESVVRDDVMLKELIDDIHNGYIPYFTLVGKLRRRDGQAERVVYRNCLPDGSVDLQKISPGEIVSRAWTFAINASPEMLENFTGVQGQRSDIYG